MIDKKRLNTTEESLKKNQSHSEWGDYFGKMPKDVMDKEYGKIVVDFFQPHNIEAQKKIWLNQPVGICFSKIRMVKKKKYGWSLLSWY